MISFGVTVRMEIGMAGVAGYAGPALGPELRCTDRDVDMPHPMSHVRARRCCLLPHSVRLIHKVY